MAEAKTKATTLSVAKFIAGVKPEERRKDCLEVIRMMQRATKAEPVMWGTSIVGFGRRTYQGASGTSDWMIIGFSPRKTALTLYVGLGGGHDPALLAKLGKHKTGKGCLYIGKLADVDVKVLQKVIDAAAAAAAKPAQAAKKA